MSILGAIAIQLGVALSSEAWTEAQMLKARFPRKLTRKQRGFLSAHLYHLYA
jgi:hypothetical protein